MLLAREKGLADAKLYTDSKAAQAQCMTDECPPPLHLSIMLPPFPPK